MDTSIWQPNNLNPIIKFRLIHNIMTPLAYHSFSSSVMLLSVLYIASLCHVTSLVLLLYIATFRYVRYVITSLMLLYIATFRSLLHSCSVQFNVYDCISSSIMLCAGHYLEV